MKRQKVNQVKTFTESFPKNPILKRSLRDAYRQEHQALAAEQKAATRLHGSVSSCSIKPPPIAAVEDDDDDAKPGLNIVAL